MKPKNRCLCFILVAFFFFLSTTWAAAQAATITINGSTTQGAVSALLFGNNIEWSSSGNGIWDAGTQSFKAGIKPLLESLRLGVMRFPGGVLSDQYFWRYGIGDPGTRQYNIAQDGNLQKSVFGTDEFYKLLYLTGAEGLVTVNVGTGTAEDAANWVEYCNGSTATEWGKNRAQNGYPEPFRLKHWELGNELYGAWEPGNCDITTYTQRVVAFAKAMKQKDPSIKLGAVAMREAGGVGAKDTNKEWNKTLLENAGDLIDFLSIHPYEPGIDGQTITFFVNETRAVSFDVPQAGQYSIKITARGTPCNNVFPIMECRVDNRPPFQISVNSESGKKFTFTDRISEGHHQLVISFINDAYTPPEDRNLFISRIEVQGNSTAQQINLPDESELFKAAMASPKHTELQIQELKALIETVLPQRSSAIKIAATEYNAVYGIEPSQLALSTHFKSALLAADLIHVFLRNQLYMVNFWSLMGPGALGCIKDPQGLTRRPSFHVLSMLSSHKGNSLLSIAVTAPTFSCSLYGDVKVFKDVPYLSAIASLNQNKTKIVLSVINKHKSKPIETSISLSDFIPNKLVNSVTLTAPSINASNEQNPETIIPIAKQITLSNVSPRFNYSFPPRSLSIIELTKGFASIQPPTGLRAVIP